MNDAMVDLTPKLYMESLCRRVILQTEQLDPLGGALLVLNSSDWLSPIWPIAPLVMYKLNFNLNLLSLHSQLAMRKPIVAHIHWYPFVRVATHGSICAST
jgi:hypothetical protein